MPRRPSLVRLPTGHPAQMAYIDSMKTPWAVAGIAALLFVSCGKNTKKVPTPEAPAAGGNPLMAPVDYLGAQAQGKRTATKAISVAEVTQAIQKFNAMEDRYPQNLNELVQQHYLQQVPTPP